MIKSLVASALVASTALIAAPAAEAATCRYHDGYRLCTELLDGYNTRGNEVWAVLVDNNHGKHDLVVECQGKTWYQWWSPRRSARDSQFQAFAKAWCEL